MFDKNKKTGFNNGKRSEIKKTIDEAFLGVHQPAEIFAMNLAFFVHQNGGNKKYYTRSEIKTVVGFKEGIDSEWQLSIFVEGFFAEVRYGKGRPPKFLNVEELYRLKTDDEIGQMGMDILEKHLNFKRIDGEDFGQYMIRLICVYFRLKPHELIAEIFRQLWKHPAIYPYRKHFEAMPTEERLPELKRLLNFRS